MYGRNKHIDMWDTTVVSVLTIGQIETPFDLLACGTLHVRLTEKVGKPTHPESSDM